MTGQASKAPREGEASARTFRACRTGSRCGVCRLLDEHPAKETTIFESLLSDESLLLEGLQRLAGLFYDASPATRVT